jgi:Uri superfamily endonuclease
MGGLAGRLGHHTGPHPKPRWHIDYLLPRSRLVAILTAESPERLECNLARGLAKQFHVFGGFGSSDCRCKGHLFHARRLGDLKLAAAEAVRRRGYEPIMLSGKGVQRG